MSTGSFESEIQDLRVKVGKFRQRAAEAGGERQLTEETLTELSNALEELRVSSEDLNRQHRELEIAHLERERERRRYLDLFQSAPDGYVVTDLDGRIVEANNAAVRLLHVPLSTLEGTLFSARVHPSDISRWTELLRVDGPAVSVTELHLRRRGERSFPAAVTRTIISGEEGPATGFRWSLHDLTALKEHESRLRQSERLLRSLVDGAKDFAIFRLDVSGKIASWNEGAERIFGYDHSEVLGRPFDMLRPLDDRSTSEKQLLTRADRYGRAEVEAWQLHKNGRRLWTNSVLTPLRDLQSRLTGFVRVLRDVSDRRRAEEALAERSRLSALQADVGAALTEGGDPANLMLSCAKAIAVNLHARQVRIWTLEEEGEELHLRAVAGDQSRKQRDDRVPLASRESVARVARIRRAHLLEPSAPKTGPRGTAPAGTKETWYVGQPMILEGRVIGVLEIDSHIPLDDASLQTLETLSRSIALGVLRLIAEERLARTVEQLEQILKTVPDAVFTLDDQDRLVQWNHKLEQVTGLSAQQLKGRRLVRFIPKSEVSRFEEGLEQARRTGTSECEAHVRRPDGTLAPVSWALALRRVSGKVLGLTGTGRDVTEKREIEMRLAQLSRYILHSREEEQRRISRELHDSTAQNLSAVCMNLARLRDSQSKIDGLSARTIDETAELAERSLAEIRTISYLLHPPLLDEVGLPAALRWFVKGFSRRSGIKVRLELPPALRRMEAELEIALFRIVQELLSNVHRHARASAARVLIRRRKGMLLLQIEDDGRGVSALTEARERGRARRGAAGVSKKRRSLRVGSKIDWMGLGLMGIRERVAERQGRLDIVSGTKGTTVRVELPIEERAAS